MRVGNLQVITFCLEARNLFVMNKNCSYTCTARFIPTYLTNSHALTHSLTLRTPEFLLRLFNCRVYKCLWFYTVWGDSWVFNKALSTL